MMFITELVAIGSRVPIDGKVIVTNGFSDVQLDEDSISNSSNEGIHY